MITVGVLLAILASGTHWVTETNPADIQQVGNGRWLLTPLVNQRYIGHRYRAVEVLFADSVTTPPRLWLGDRLLRIETDSDASYVIATLGTSFDRKDVLLVSEARPIQAAFALEIPLSRVNRESFSSSGFHSWSFSTPAPLPKPWELVGTDARVAVLDSLPFLVLRTGGSNRLRTTDRWQGLRAARFPVIVIQMQVGSGVGSGVLSWNSVERGIGSWRFRLSRRGEWSQLIVPVVRHPQWRGTIQRLELSPATHRSTAKLDWIQLPPVAPVWALLLTSAGARWLAFGILFLICLAIVLANERDLSIDSALVAAVSACAIVPLLQPFDELRPAFRFHGFVVPSYMPVFAAIAILRWRRTLQIVDLGAWLCGAVTVALGLVVAHGAGLQRAVGLVALPLAFLAGRATAKHGGSDWTVTILAGSSALLCLHAILFPSVSEDPVYGSLLSSLGRTYWDSTVFGRVAGAFVHPLVLATVSITLGIVILSRDLSKKRALLVVAGILLLGGVFSGSRVFLALLAIAITVAALQGRVIHATVALLVALAAFLVFVSRAPHTEHLSRGLHIEKRMAGLDVMAKTLEAKPLQGVGWGSYRSAVRRFGPSKAKLVPFTTPDNSFARFFTEGGLLGGSVWLGWLILIVYSCQRRRSTTAVFPSWIAPAFFVVTWLTFDAAYWEAASLPVCLALGSTIE